MGRQVYQRSVKTVNARGVAVRRILETCIWTYDRGYSKFIR